MDKSIIIKICLDGNAYCALVGENLQVGISGFGDSEAKALKKLIENLPMYDLESVINKHAKIKKEVMIKPKVICICGSTRFADLHAIMRFSLEKTGEAICLMINYLPEWYCKEELGLKTLDHFGEQLGIKETMDELHLRKIDLADEVFVVNKDGYIGESTRKEIEYAKSLGKPIKYLENIN
jgi:hypothetical protein